MSNQECKVRPTRVDISSNEPIFYPQSVVTNKAAVAAMILITNSLNYAPLMLLRV